MMPRGFQTKLVKQVKLDIAVIQKALNNIDTELDLTSGEGHERRIDIAAEATRRLQKIFKAIEKIRARVRDTLCLAQEKPEISLLEAVYLKIVARLQAFASQN